MKLKRKMMTRLNRQRGWCRHPISARAVVLKNRLKDLQGVSCAEVKNGHFSNLAVQEFVI